MADAEGLSVPKEISYHRRCDRSPEKTFDIFSDNDKKLICEIRRATETARNKLTKLEDEVSDRDREIERERELRKSAEEKLHSHLKDLYVDPQVNHELRQRLPRANKTAPLLTQQGNGEKEEEVMDNTATSQKATTIEESLTSEQLGKQENHKFSTSNKTKNENGSGAIPKQRLLNETPRFTSYQLQPHSMVDSPRRFPSSSILSQSIPLHYNYSSYGTPPYMSMSTPPMYFNSPVPSPFISGAGQTSSYSYNLGLPQTQSSEGSAGGPDHPEEETSIQAANANLSHSDGPMNINDLHSSPMKQSQEENSDSKDSNIKASAKSYQQHGIETFPRPVYISHNSSQIPSHYQVPPLSHAHNLPANLIAASNNPADQAKQISLLLSELDASKAQCKKLAGKLVDTERELDTAKILLDMKDVQRMETTETGKAAGLIREIHAAQRKREESMMGRLSIANQEKEEALSRLQDLEHKMDEGYSESDRLDFEQDLEEEDLNVKLDEIMSEFGQTDVGLGQTDTVYGFDRECSSIVNKMAKVKERQREITTEEMHTLIEERDRALAKARKLEDELLREQRLNSGMTIKSEAQVKTKLACVEQERDMALAQVRKLKDEIQTIRIYYSLHKSLSQESLLRDQVNNTLHAYQSKVAEASHSQKDNNLLLAELRNITEERDQMARDLEKMEHAAEENRREKEKLKKLVSVLRKKMKHYVESKDSGYDSQKGHGENY